MRHPRWLVSATILLLCGSLGLAVQAGAQVRVPSRLVVRTASDASSSLHYAAERLAAEMRGLYGLRVRVVAGDDEQAVGGSEEEGVITLREDKAITLLPVPAGLANAREACGPWRPEAWRITTTAEPFEVVIAGVDGASAWYGACEWLDSLRPGAGGVPFSAIGEHTGSPTLALRVTRPIRASGPSSSGPELEADLDWWARWRMNVARIDSRPDEVMRQVLAEAHRRGIRLLLGLGVRTLCAADDAAVAERVGEMVRFLDLGGDGVSMLWDDLPHARAEGHCDRCRERFGPDSMAQEMVHVLEALCRAAEGRPKPPIIAWCPSHYSASRYPAFTDERYYAVVGASALVRERTCLFHCEYRPDRVDLLDRFGLFGRIWWYNGLRSVFSNCQRWPTQREMKLDLPKDVMPKEPDFPHFDWGWKMGLGIAPDGAIIPPPEETWVAMRALPAHFAGFYPCTPTHPYHAAVSGLFALAPERFDQAEADRVVFRAMFGPAGEGPARRWSDLYNQLQIWLAQAWAGSPRRQDRAQAIEWLEGMAAARSELVAVAAQGRHVLDAGLVREVLERMDAAREQVEKVYQQLAATQPE
ncbi:MAG: hypothetical protein GXY55_15755 [Phycisphaerae bacterium]|nr:hypothetical protein [Phycisphaerae bacterium]